MKKAAGLIVLFAFIACTHTPEPADNKVEIPPEEKTEFPEKVDPASAEVSERRAGGLILTFDDFSFTWLEMIPLLEEYGGHATFYISLDELEDEQLSVLKKLQGTGHEIGWHTSTHPDMRKIPVSRRSEVLDREILSPLRTLKEYLQADIAAFAYPYGFSDKDWEERLSGVFTSTRGFCRTPRYYSPEQLEEERYFKAASLDNLFFTEEEASFPDFCGSVLEELSGSSVYTILGSHGLDREDWGITAEHLIYLLSEAAHKNIPVLSMEEAFSR